MNALCVVGKLKGMEWNGMVWVGAPILRCREKNVIGDFKRSFQFRYDLSAFLDVFTPKFAFSARYFSLDLVGALISCCLYCTSRAGLHLYVNHVM